MTDSAWSKDLFRTRGPRTYTEVLTEQEVNELLPGDIFINEKYPQATTYWHGENDGWKFEYRRPAGAALREVYRWTDEPKEVWVRSDGIVAEDSDLTDYVFKPRAGEGFVADMLGKIYGPDKHVNDAGGVQSKLEYSFDSLDPAAMLAMTKVLQTGKDLYGKDNWRNISVEDHIAHANTHLFQHLAGDSTEDHLAHAMCRTMMAKAVSND